MKKNILLFLTILGLALSCGMIKAQPAQAAAKAQPAILQDAVQRGTLRVGFSSFVPWAMQDKKGAYIGFEVDVATRLAKDFGLKLEMVPTRWSGIVPALLTGKFDVIVSGLSITPERSLKVNFTIPYDMSGIEVVGKKEHMGQKQSLEHFDTPDMVIAARTGSTAAMAARVVLPKATLRLFDDEAPAVQEMLSGRAHLLFASAPLGTFEVVRDPENIRSLTSELLFRQPIAMAVRKGDYDTVNALDGWIRLVEAEGWLRERKAYWFESRQWESLLQ